MRIDLKEVINLTSFQNLKKEVMTELVSAVTPQIYEDAVFYVRHLLKRDVSIDDLWRFMDTAISEARNEYRKRFVDWFQPRHVEQAQRELADIIIRDIWDLWEDD